MPLDGGFGSDERTVRKDFTFATSSPLAVDTQDSDEMIVRTDVVITTAFDGASPVLRVGTAGSPGLILDTNEIKPKRTDQYTTHEVIDVPGTPTSIQLLIAPSGSTAGAGFITQTYRKA